MRKKFFAAIILTTLLLCNTAFADTSYILYIPDGNEDITTKQNAYSELGTLSVTSSAGNFDENYAVDVTLSYSGKYKNQDDESETLAYRIVEGTSDDNTAIANGNAVEFVHESIDAQQEAVLGMVMTGDPDNVAEGDYKDTLTFTASVVADPLRVNGIVIRSDYEAQDGDVLTGRHRGKYKISVADGATITLSSVDMSGLQNSLSQFYAGITCNGDATIILKGNNVVKGGREVFPGIFAAANSTLTIKGDGSLTASSNGDGAGIGGGYKRDCGNIVIEGGTITSTSGYGAAGIGGGFSASCGDITISGGVITSTGGIYSAGIGSGFRASCGNIIISGGTITATGGDAGAGIGCGMESSCGDITIKNTVTSVTAKSIGTIGNGSCGKITIEDGANVIQN